MSSFLLTFASSFFSPILGHLYTLCHVNSGEVDFRSRSRFPLDGGVLICHFYLFLINYHHKFSIHILKREDSSLLNCAIRCRLEKNVSGWLLNTALQSEGWHRFFGTCCKKLNRCKCFFWNPIDASWIFLGGGYTCLYICYHNGWADWEYMSFSQAVSDYVSSWYREFFPCFNQDRFHVVSLKPLGNILHNPLRLRNFVESLKFWVKPVVIGLVVDGIALFKYESLAVFLCIFVRVRLSKWLSCPSKKIIWLLTGEALHMLDNWVMALSHPSLPMYPDGVVVDCPVQWDSVMEILGVILGLVNNDGRHESFLISSC